jgi:hypothetical protein
MGSSGSGEAFVLGVYYLQNLCLFERKMPSFIQVRDDSHSRVRAIDQGSRELHESRT